MVENIAMISVGMNYTVVYRMLHVFSDYKASSLLLEILLSSCIRIMPSLRVIQSITSVLGSENDMVVGGICRPMKLVHLAEVVGFLCLISWSSSMEYFSNHTRLALDMMNGCG
jgi:hypothetical protein